jgi:ubiquinone/menaquinone biosynthesis C-methylase UbiE
MKIDPEDCDVIERAVRAKYTGATYQAKSISYLPDSASGTYFHVLLRLKLDLVARYAGRADVLDLCCGNGEHLLSIAETVRAGIGLDFSNPYIDQARESCAGRGVDNISFVLGSARSLPFDAASFDLVYSFSSLYYVPNLGEIVSEVARVLKPGGTALLELGNRYSLNTLVCRACPELATPCHVSLRQVKRLLREANLTVQEDRAFQILPLWGDRPRWLRPLLHPWWQRILQKQVGGRMLDEWLSNLPVLKALAFRHILVCRK